MSASHTVLRLVIRKEEGRKWRDEIDLFDDSAELVSLAFLAFAGWSMYFGIAYILGQVAAALIWEVEIPHLLAAMKNCP
ncbi:hypothetical protein ACQ7DA_16915 [Zafaria sp. J156]|uniref:hypothetical protein n=1 Tax=Zafaria sp. J156 TaxID=3116490 RepID=UPI002E9EC88D|nr:hypothetical protein [Zafaria sp. J156]